MKMLSDLSPLEREIQEKTEKIAKQYTLRFWILGLLALTADIAMIRAVWNGIFAKYITGVFPLSTWAAILLGIAFVIFLNKMKPTPEKITDVMVWIEKFKVVEKSASRTITVQLLLMVAIEYLA